MKGTSFSLFRRTLAASLIAGFVVTVGGVRPAVAQSVTVNVGGQPLYLNPGPIERAGRVFVPLRGIFERLGAAVVYSAGTINASKGSTTVSLRIGSTQATINGQPQYLDVAPFIVGATTYVPLRFVAQSLGANVGYHDATRVVSITGVGGGNGYRPPPYPPYPPPPVYPPGGQPMVQLRAQQPAPESKVGNRFVVISAEFCCGGQIEAGSVRIRLDGNDVTSRSGVSSTGFSYKPPAPLDFGSHTVRATGRNVRGLSFDRSWSFIVIRSGPPSISLTINQPAPNAPVGRSFVIQGTTLAYARINVTAGASPLTVGQFSGTTTAGQLGNFKITVNLTALPGQSAVRVKVTATDPATSQTTETVMQLRLNQ